MGGNYVTTLLSHLQFWRRCRRVESFIGESFIFLLDGRIQQVLTLRIESLADEQQWRTMLAFLFGGGEQGGGACSSLWLV